MKKLILSVLTILAIYALLYGIWSFAHWNFNPKDWEIGSRVFYCFMSTAVSTYASIIIGLHDDKKS